MGSQRATVSGGCCAAPGTFRVISACPIDPHCKGYVIDWRRCRGLGLSLSWNPVNDSPATVQRRFALTPHVGIGRFQRSARFPSLALRTASVIVEPVLMLKRSEVLTS